MHARVHTRTQHTFSTYTHRKNGSSCRWFWCDFKIVLNRFLRLPDFQFPLSIDLVCSQFFFSQSTKKLANHTTVFRRLHIIRNNFTFQLIFSIAAKEINSFYFRQCSCLFRAKSQSVRYKIELCVMFCSICAYVRLGSLSSALSIFNIPNRLYV